MYTTAANAAASEAARKEESVAEANCSMIEVLTAEEEGNQEDPNNTQTAYQVEVTLGNGRQRTQRNQHRCRKCGHC